MDKTEQILRAMIERQNKNSAYLKIITALILISQLIVGHIICVNIALAERKIDYRYFNLVSSLEAIHGVYIDTYDGKVYKTKEELKDAQDNRAKDTKRSFFKKYVKLMVN